MAAKGGDSCRPNIFKGYTLSLWAAADVILVVGPIPDIYHRGKSETAESESEKALAATI